jgi:hypothetical protein
MKRPFMLALSLLISACGYDASPPSPALADAAWPPDADAGADGATGDGGATGSPDAGRSDGGQLPVQDGGSGCVTAADCDDDNPCTVDACSFNGQCTRTASGPTHCTTPAGSGCCRAQVCCVGPGCCF